MPHGGTVDKTHLSRNSRSIGFMEAEHLLEGPAPRSSAHIQIDPDTCHALSTSLMVRVDGLYDHLDLRSRGQSGGGERGACRRNLYLSDPIGIYLIHGLEIIDVIE